MRIEDITMSCRLSLSAGDSGDSDGLWQTYDGGLIAREMDLDGKGPKPVLIIIELITLAIAASVPCLEDHNAEKRGIGYWTDSIVKNNLLFQRLHLLKIVQDDKPKGEEYWTAEGMRGLLASKMPLEASIRTQPDLERNGAWVELMEPEEINGRKLDPSTYKYPIFVLRNGILRETSIVTLGAARSTGQIAASFSAAALTGNQKEPNMPNMAERKAALLEKHGDEYKELILDMIVDEKDDDEISAAIAEKKEGDEKEAAAAKLAEAEKNLEAEKEKTKDLEAKLSKSNKELQEVRLKLGQPPQIPNETARLTIGDPAQVAASGKMTAEESAQLVRDHLAGKFKQ